MALNDLDEVAMKLVQGWKAAPYRNTAQAEHRLQCLIRDALVVEREYIAKAPLVENFQNHKLYFHFLESTTYCPYRKAAGSLQEAFSEWLVVFEKVMK